MYTKGAHVLNKHNFEKACLLKKIGFDTVENGPSKAWGYWGIGLGSSREFEPCQVIGLDNVARARMLEKRSFDLQKNIVSRIQ